MLGIEMQRENFSFQKSFSIAWALHGQPGHAATRYMGKGSDGRGILAAARAACRCEVIVMNTICGLAFGQLWPQLSLSCKALQGARYCKALLKMQGERGPAPLTLLIWAQVLQA